jgi:hypothetical protein
MGDTVMSSPALKSRAAKRPLPISTNNDERKEIFRKKASIMEIW